MKKPHGYSHYRQNLCAVMFSIFLFQVALGSIVLMMMSMDPVILGTEMNTNGMVEYLCLGNGCESYRDMYWKD